MNLEENQIASLFSPEELGEFRSITQGPSSDWASTHVVTYEKMVFFVKKTTTDAEGEAEGLKALALYSGDIKIPRVYFSDRINQSKFGRDLALMHKSTMGGNSSLLYGFDVENSIGGTPQVNTKSSDWLDFFTRQRLMHQLLLTHHPPLIALGQQLCAKIAVFFVDAVVWPAPLHGDLWSGNISTTSSSPTHTLQSDNNTICLYDPAFYFGHHEAEFGMSWCSCFTKEFFDAYFAVIPKQKGFDERVELYTLYHILNHYNLFGGSYLQQSEKIIKRLLSKIDRLVD